MGPLNKAESTPSAYSAHVFVGKHVNTPSRIYCSEWGGARDVRMGGLGEGAAPPSLVSVGKFKDGPP